MLAIYPEKLTEEVYQVLENLKHVTLNYLTHQGQPPRRLDTVSKIFSNFEV